jgi:hypothetical protein
MKLPPRNIIQLMVLVVGLVVGHLSSAFLRTENADWIGVAAGVLAGYGLCWFNMVAYEAWREARHEVYAEQKMRMWKLDQMDERKEGKHGNQD